MQDTPTNAPEVLPFGILGHSLALVGAAFGHCGAGEKESQHGIMGKEEQVCGMNIGVSEPKTNTFMGATWACL